MKKLNFGCGSIQPEGWVNFDLDPQFNANEVPLRQEEFDIIVAHCSIQMNDFNDIVGLLAFLYRCLKPGGVLRISLPDIEAGFKALSEGRIDWFPNGEDNIDDRFSAWLTWYSTTKTLLTPLALIHKLREVGFSKTTATHFKETKFSTEEIFELDTRENECYFVEARK